MCILQLQQSLSSDVFGANESIAKCRWSDDLVPLYPMFITHLYILYLVEKPCRFFSTKSMYSGE